ncbi:MAG: molybdopterin-dependent oxidoreductase [Chloroflexi bacterium]|nr:molybdopterin-dependent oxidoreductase [Chloroflexota bacterium]
MANGKEEVITTVCSCHCGGAACIIKAYVKDGVITRLETDDGPEPQIRACARGRSYRQRVYSPDRLKYPLRRVGARGEGKFERITWDEALENVARELKRVRDTYGPASIALAGSAGDLTMLHWCGPTQRLLRMLGGCTSYWGLFSNEGGNFASHACYGTTSTRSTHDDLLNSRLIILWGWNPSVTVAGANTSWYLAQAREKGTKIVSIDPRYTDSTSAFASQWIPILPGTDTAMLLAMAYVIIEGKLQDQPFLDKYTVGFDAFKTYVLGEEDGVPKTPAWAQAITGVSAAIIRNLAIEYATSKPAALMCGIAPGRTAYGEQYHRAAITLSAMTGNIGIHGGSSAGNAWAVTLGGYPFVKMPRMTGGVGDVLNPVEAGAPRRKYALSSYGELASSAKLHRAFLADAILKGKAGGYPSDIKLLYAVCTSFPNQYPDINKAVQAIQKLEFFIVHEQFMTPAARYADIVLPASSLYERNDVSTGYGIPPFIGYVRKLIEPLYESKSHMEIGTALAGKLGISGYNDRTDDEWLREMVGKRVSDYDTFKGRGFQRAELTDSYVAFKEQIDDPAKHPFPTPSGKIEIYSRQLAEMCHPQLPPIPKYIESWESRNDVLRTKYPLQLISSHFLRRSHTQFDNVLWLRETQPQAVMLNSADAAARNIKDGDKVRVFNDRGEMVIEAKVTERIMPGVADVPQGAWFNPDSRGVDRGGSANVLTKDEPSPGGAFPYNTALVQVEMVR